MNHQGTLLKKWMNAAAIFVGIFCLVFGMRRYLVHEKKNMEARLREQLKQEMYQDLRAEMYELVKKEVAAELENRIAYNTSAVSSEQLAGISEAPIAAGAISREVKKFAREYFEDHKNYVNPISDESLDQVVAGRGIEPNLKVAPGIYKNPAQPEYYLAKAADGESASSEKFSLENSSQNDGDGHPPGKERSESIERVLQQRGSVLLPKGRLQFEPSVSWSHFSSNRINIDGLLLLDVFAIGEISTETVRRDIFMQNFSFKYGMFDNFQADLRLPFRQEYDRITRTSGSETTNSAAGIGDIDFGVSRQIGWEEGWKPDLIASFGVKTPSGKEPYSREIGLGTGHWAVRSALVAAKSSDPAVIFGSLNYTYNVARDGIDGIGDVDPGDSIGYSFGTAIALSYQTAINFSFNHSLTLKTKRNGQEVVGSFLNVASLRTGMNWAINEKSSVDLGVSIGITRDSPDVTVDIRFPYLF